MASIRPLVIIGAIAVAIASCKTDQVLVAPSITYPAKAVEGSQAVWGTLNGVSILGGYGSGLAADPQDPNSFYVMSDRGPNVATSVAGQLLFPLPTFNPNIVKYTVVGDTLRKQYVIELKNAAGVRLTGIPNPPGNGGTGETAVGPGNISIAFDPEGIDAEGLAIAPDGTFWVSDEYGPHIVHFDMTGRTIERLNPFGTGTGSRKIPLVLAKRRANRGMEGLAITPDGRNLLGGMQNPLDNPTAAIGRLSNANRLLLVDITSGTTKQFVYEVDVVGNYIGDITAISGTEFLVDERDGNLAGGNPPAVTKKIYKISINGATDVSDPTNDAGGKQFGGKVLEALSVTERAVAGITPVTKTLVYDLLTLPGGYPHDKFEGLALVGNSWLVVANDDDFGVVDAGGLSIGPKLLASGIRDRLTLYFIRLTAPLR